MIVLKSYGCDEIELNGQISPPPFLSLGEVSFLLTSPLPPAGSLASLGVYGGTCSSWICNGGNAVFGLVGLCNDPPFALLG